MRRKQTHPVNLICIKAPPPAAQKNKTVNFLSDLGKATKRGVRRCPNCGQINGTRCIKCKNTMCNMIFKESDKQKVLLDSCKLVTGTTREIYSVLVREKGPMQRGFVQLPCKSKENSMDFEMALCFVNNCQRSFDDSILKCHENCDNSNTTCMHIESAMKTASTAHGVPFKHNLINNLLVDEEIKKKLCSLAKSTEGPVVQKINKKIFAVKCAVTATNPLGYLHVLFNLSTSSGNEEIDSFECSCNIRSDGNCEKCIHYYACVVAFASDNRITHKYKHLLKKEFDSSMDFNCDDSAANNIEIEVLQTNLLPNFMKSTVNKPLTIAPDLSKSCKMQIVNVPPPEEKSPSLKYDVLSFQDWLSSVTERINQPDNEQDEETLSFHIPDRFYELLKGRITCIRKDTTPDELTSVIRKAAPVGIFECEIWRIDNMAELKKLFNSKETKLVRSHLIVNKENPLTMYWMGGLLKTTKFGELKITYRTNENV